ncbi:MAG: methyltransferase domain-containing protein [Gammaproteobacteria bacterium]|nr:methyltransferase domain-containing protein [Gammaproteobacteria bacterium]
MSGSGDRRSGWERRYREGRTAWDRGSVSPALTHWLDADGGVRGRVLVPGCGHGHEVVALVRAGCDVTAVDIAAAPVMRLRARLADAALHADVVQADLLHWQPAGPFDAIYEQTCLCALAPADWPAYEHRLADWLPPGGRLYALFMQTGRDGGPPFDCPLPAMRELFVGSRWLWPHVPALDVPHPSGFVEEGLVLIRR